MTSSPSSANAGAGASIQLAVQSGQSPLPRVAYQPGVPPTRSTVGSGGDVEWPLSAPGVELRHAEIAWDGAQVWVRDLGSQRGTFVDSTRIGADWVAVAPGSQIRLGQAVIAATAIGGAAMTAAAPNARSGDFDDDQPTRMVQDNVVPQAPLSQPLPRAGGPAPLPKAPSTGAFAAEGGGDSTVIVQSPFESGGGGGGKPAFASTDPRGAPAGAVPLPRIGKVTGQGAIPGPGAMPPVSGPANSESTVAFSIPDELPPAPMLNRPAAGQPMGAAPPFGAPAPNAFGAVPTQLNAPSTDGGGFTQGGGSVGSVFGSIPPPPPVDPNAGKKPLFTLPKRTLIMMTAALAAAGGLLLFGEKHPPPGPEHPVVTAPEVPTTPVVHYTPPIGGAPADPTGTLLAASVGVQPPPPPDPHARRPAANAPPTPVETPPERAAADTLAQGRLRDAISQYDALAIAHPETPVFAHVAVILRRKLESQGQQCPPGSPPTCVPVAPIPTPPPVAAMVGAAPTVAPNAVPAPQPAPAMQPGVQPTAVPPGTPPAAVPGATVQPGAVPGAPAQPGAPMMVPTAPGVAPQPGAPMMVPAAPGVAPQPGAPMMQPAPTAPAAQPTAAPGGT